MLNITIVAQTIEAVTRSLTLPSFTIESAQALADNQNALDLPDLHEAKELTAEDMIAWCGLQYAYKIMEGYPSDPYKKPVNVPREKVAITMKSPSWTLIGYAVPIDCAAINMSRAVTETHGVAVFLRRAVEHECARD